MENKSIFREIMRNKSVFREIMRNKSVFREIVEESVVLLKNEHQTLPLGEHTKAAFFGRAQTETFFSGNGSGASRAMEAKSLLTECEKSGILAVPELKEFYKARQEIEPGKFAADGVDITDVGELTSGFMYEIFGRYQAQCEEYDIPGELVRQAGNQTDTAIFVLGRNCGGEECDRHLEADYYLTDSEVKLIGQISRVFGKIILILNINGLIDLGWLDQYPMIQSVLFMGIPGEEGCGAVADILTGKVNPSGKLPVSIAKKYEDYPAAEYFTWDKEKPEQILTYESYGLSAEENGSAGYDKSPVTFYQEDIYAGYRYFDSFGREVLFPFGYGLSYSRFEIRPVQILHCSDGIEVIAEVANVGNCPGKETVQVYLSCRNTASERPYQELKGFEKTKLLEPGEEEELHIWVPLKELSCYVEERAAYVIEKGSYLFLVGNSSRQTEPAGEIVMEEDILMQQCANRLSLKACNQGKLHFLSKRVVAGGAAGTDEVAGTDGAGAHGEMEAQAASGDGLKERPDAEPAAKDDAEERPDAEPAAGDDVELRLAAEPVSDSRVRDLSVRELAALCVGYGPGTPFAAFGGGKDPETIFDSQGNPLTANSHPVGANGYVSPAIEEKGICSVFYKDGPAGVGTGAWPTEMLTACAYNKELWRRFGDAAGAACEEKQVDVWLAPAVNLHRHPLCGRNFEYFSEDPYLTGICAVQIAKGVQEKHRVQVCPKHFAVNEQESFRRGSAKKQYDAADSLITERAARELYLKPFEMLVRDAGISFLMTSFNKINGTFAGGNKDLCTHILRGEWGFDGVVVTDWGDMDIVVDGADAVAAGNDIVMPGGPPVIAQILKGFEEGRVGREEMERSVSRLLRAAGECGRSR